MASLLKVFNDQSASDRIVQFLRLLTSAFIRNRADFFRHFIDEEMDIKDFCTHVGPPGLGLWGRCPQPWALFSTLSPEHLSTSLLARSILLISQPAASSVNCLNCVALGLRFPI